MIPVFKFALFAPVLLVGLFLATPPVPAEPKEDQPPAVFHRDRDHLWNRVHAAFNIRVGPDGRSYGEDRLEPLLWYQSEYLLEGKAADGAVAVLQEFLRDKGEFSL